MRSALAARRRSTVGDLVRRRRAVGHPGPEGGHLADLGDQQRLVGEREDLVRPAPVLGVGDEGLDRAGAPGGGPEPEVGVVAVRRREWPAGRVLEVAGLPGPVAHGVVEEGALAARPARRDDRVPGVPQTLEPLVDVRSRRRRPRPSRPRPTACSATAASGPSGPCRRTTAGRTCRRCGRTAAAPGRRSAGSCRCLRPRPASRAAGSAAAAPGTARRLPADARVPGPRPAGRTPSRDRRSGPAAVCGCRSSPVLLGSLTCGGPVWLRIHTPSPLQRET